MTNIVKKKDVVNIYYEKINALIINTRHKLVKNINFDGIDLYYNIGLIINELIEKYNLFASKYKLYLPTEKEFISEIERTKIEI